MGSLGGVTFRVLEMLRAADVVLCADTRHTRLLRDRSGITARPLSFQEHNEAERTGQVLARVEAGELVALVSDAGMPGISDPGGRLVRVALASGQPVTVLPGPTAVETALVASGLVAERYGFVGFLPRRPLELTALSEELRAVAWPVVAFESQRRLPASLTSLAAALPGREVAVFRELTKRFEEVVRGPVETVVERFAAAP